MNRKIVNCFINEKCIVVLCEDGTLWVMPEYMSHWMKLPAIPSDDEYAAMEKKVMGNLTRQMNASQMQSQAPAKSSWR